jgi:hypothetical protein
MLTGGRQTLIKLQVARPYQIASILVKISIYQLPMDDKPSVLL